MTTREKQRAKKEKINEIILAPFKVAFPYEDDCMKWFVERNKICIQFDNRFHLGVFFDYQVLGNFDTIYIPKNFDFTNKEKIKIIKDCIKNHLEKHYIQEHLFSVMLLSLSDEKMKILSDNFLNYKNKLNEI